MNLMAQLDPSSIPTSLGGVAILCLTYVVYAYFRDRKYTPRDIEKTLNLKEQTELLRTLVQNMKQGDRKARKASKKHLRLLREVHGTVSDIREDQQKRRRL